MNDFQFFEDSKAEMRRYRLSMRARWKVLRSLVASDQISSICDAAGREVVRGSHIMAPGNPVGLAQVNERFNITLPDDIDQFYRLHNGGYLLFREVYRLMPVDQIIQWTLDFRTGEDAKVPYHVIRFCDLGDSQCVALRRGPSGNWAVMYAEPGFSTDQLLNDEELIRDYTWDDSFTAWLKRMCATDGWPSGIRAYADDEAPLQRVG